MTNNLLKTGLTILIIVFSIVSSNAQVSGYDTYSEISTNISQIEGNQDLQNFAMLVNITAPYLRSTSNGGLVSNPNGYDIAFTNSTNSETLKHEIESFDPINGHLVAWVNIPLLSYNNTTTIRMYVGNSSVSTPSNAGSTWHSSYLSVWHLNNNLLDATSNNNGTNNGSLNANGIISGGKEFNSNNDNNDNIDLGSFSVSGNKLTVSAWFKADDFDYDDGRIISKATSQNENDHWFMLSTIKTSNDYRLRFRLKTNNSTTTLIASTGNLSLNTWYYATAVYDGSEMRLYLNGELVGSTNKTGNMNINNTVKVFIGNNPGANLKPFDGKIDEVRIKAQAINQSWLRTEFNNQSNPSQFYTISNIDYPNNGTGNDTLPNSNSCGQKIDFVGTGANGQSSVELNIPNISDIDSILVESVYKGSTPSNVQFSSSNETITDYTPEAAINGSGGRFMAMMQPTNSIIVSSSNTSTTQSAVAYIYRSNPNYRVHSFMDDTKVYLYHNSYQKSFSIPESNQTRTITAYVPVAELNNDTRLVEMTVTAGSVSRTVTAYTENLGESLRLFVIVLNNVPGDVTKVDVSIVSPNSNGDSFVAGNIILNVPCENTITHDPIAIDDYKTTSINTAVDINVLTNDSDPDNDLDYGSVNVIGLTEPENGTVTYIDPKNGMITYTPNPGFIGTDSFEYMVYDETGRASSAFVYITINQCGESYVASSGLSYAYSIAESYINPSNQHGDVNTAQYAIGAPDGQNALIHWGGDYMVLDLGTTIPAGTNIDIYWNKRNGESGTAKMVLSASNNGTSFTNQTFPSTASTNQVVASISLNTNARYLKILKNNSVSGTDFEVDGIEFLGSGTCKKDSDNDGVPDIDDIDDDNDGILDIIEGEGTDPGADIDNDGIVNYLDTNFPGFIDLNNDGVHDIFDTDFDGVPDYLDLDSDNDGISDNIEAQSTLGYIAPEIADSDGDGLLDIYDSNLAGASNSLGLTPYDHDSDNNPDFLDIDADNDGLNDWIEAFDNDFVGSAFDELIELADVFTKKSGYDYYNNNIDSNNNGTPDWLEPITPGNSLPAFLDYSSNYFMDSDNDGIVDLIDPDTFGYDLSLNLIPNTTNDKAFRDSDSKGNLPINLMSFDATCNQSGVDITWTTATETNNEFFTLEYSLNGYDFEVLDFVDGAGNSIETIEYEYFDNQKLNGTAYYRLTQTDFDGKYETFEIISVSCKQNPIVNTTLNLYPIPTQTNLNIDLNFWPTDESVQISIFDLTGKQILSKNANIIAGSLHTFINVDNFNAGQYMLRINGTSYMIQKNIIKQ